MNLLGDLSQTYPNPIQLFSTDPAVLQLQGMEANIILPGKGFLDCPPPHIAPFCMAASVLES